jgi:hypothetical protein
MNNLLMLVPQFVHVLMTIISFLNPSVIWQHLMKRTVTMPAPISQIRQGSWLESFTPWVKLSQAKKQTEVNLTCQNFHENVKL